jgi:YbbR domain-containing protein
MQEEYEIQWGIPISYKNMPNDMAFSQTPPTEIKVRVRDKGSVLLNYTLGQKKTSITVNIQETLGPDHTVLLSSRDIEGIITKQLIPTTNLLSFSPQEIKVSYSKLRKKRLPVRFDGEIRPDPGFLLSGNVVISPPEVDVFAGDVALESLSAVSTVYMEIKKGNKRIVRKLKLQEIEGVRFEPQTVSVEIPIEEYTEKTLEIPIVCRHTPQGYAIRMFPSVVRVTCNVPLSIFKELSEKDFSVEVVAGNPEQNISGMLPVRLTKKPDSIDKATLSVDSIEFILEQIK